MPNIEKVKKFKERVAQFVINAGSNGVWWLRRKLASPVEPKPAIGRLLAASGILNFGASILANRDPAYKSLMHQFHSKSNDLRVERVFKVKVPMSVYKKHVQYEKGHHSNTRRRFHGTSCSSDCNYFFDLEGAPCGSKDCNVCSICLRGFKLKENLGRTAKATKFNLRYGEGVYFSSVSGKANDYAENSQKIRDGRKWRCMFVATVAVGLAYLTKEGFLPDKMCPPPGFDAVVGEVGPNLNYDEVVVYDKAAAIPAFLIVYSTA